MEEKEKRKDLSFGLKSAAHQNDTPSIDENTQHEYLNAATSAKCARWCSGGVVVVVVWWRRRCGGVSGGGGDGISHERPGRASFADGLGWLLLNAKGELGDYIGERQDFTEVIKLVPFKRAHALAFYFRAKAKRQLRVYADAYFT